MQSGTSDDLSFEDSDSSDKEGNFDVLFDKRQKWTDTMKQKSRFPLEIPSKANSNSEHIR